MLTVLILAFIEDLTNSKFELSIWAIKITYKCVVKILFNIQVYLKYLIYQVRVCDSPAPSNGGIDCVGDILALEVCNNGTCYGTDYVNVSCF